MSTLLRKNGEAPPNNKKTGQGREVTPQEATEQQVLEADTV